MKVGEAASTVTAFLDVNTDRYPTAVSEAHINEAMLSLAREYDLPWINDSVQVTFQPPQTGDGPDVVAGWAQYPGSMAVRDLFDSSELTFDYLTAGWVDPYKKENRLLPATYEELIDEYGDDEGTTPEKYAIFADRLFIRPIPADGDSFTMRFLWAGRPAIATTDQEPRLLYHSPWGVVYRACEVASAWLLEDNRVPLFVQARKEQMDAVGVTMSMEGEDVGSAMGDP